MFPLDTKILVIDDLKTIRSLLRENLKSLGFKNVFEAENGKQGLQMLQEATKSPEPFGFIICDWNMPEMNGLELLEARNTDPDLKSVPFLMVTIESEVDYVLKAISRGVSDFIVKPFSEKTIEDKIKRIYNKINKK